mmetsp:Transcript_91111/g.257975  ORF Transcript_91111/g.257975 Transcript_91111/m.257975 type:complete len:247 (-) Transcript_91111:238-978(-)
MHHHRGRGGALPPAAPHHGGAVHHHPAREGRAARQAPDGRLAQRPTEPEPGPDRGRRARRAAVGDAEHAQGPGPAQPRLLGACRQERLPRRRPDQRGHGRLPQGVQLRLRAPGCAFLRARYAHGRLHRHLADAAAQHIPHALHPGPHPRHHRSFRRPGVLRGPALPLRGHRHHPAAQPGGPGAGEAEQARPAAAREHARVLEQRAAAHGAVALPHRSEARPLQGAPREARGHAAGGTAHKPGGHEP